MDEKRVDAAVQLDVDEMILDYLIFTATANILSDYGDCGKVDEQTSSFQRTDVLLQMVNCQSWTGPM